MDKEVIANLKALGIDMIEAARSGHPGIVLGAAPIIYTLYAKHLNISTHDVNWLNRDRFVMSSGHGSALLYATLFMAGYDLTISDLKKFRQAGSKTPGHPEVGVTPGVDMSTGPLGQGFASAVGMALAEKILESQYMVPIKNRFGMDDKKPLFQYKVYVLCGDGDLMEGITNEAASLAGTWKLNNLIVLYDSNKVSLDGDTKDYFTENVKERFQALGWDYEFVKNGEDVNAIDKAITRAKGNSKPTLIEVRTVIGRGSFQEGKHTVHGSPLGRDDIDQIRRNSGLSLEAFSYQEEAMDYFRKQIVSHSSKKYEEWASNYQAYVNRVLQGDLSSMNYLFQPSEEEISLPFRSNDLELEPELKEATRVTSGRVLEYIASKVPYFLGGSADVASSTKTYLKDYADIFPSTRYQGKNIWFGVREHAMGAILNGLALSRFRPYGSTFLAFSDYLKPAIRMSCLMHLPVTYIFTHDSITVGEDGPTHQPIEQLAMLRSMPQLNVYRPCDAHEVIGCWKSILKQNDRPSALILARTETKLLDATSIEKAMKGAYVVHAEQGPLKGIVIATGTEVHTALHAAHELKNRYGMDIRVVSMPSMELFLAQAKEYQEEILPMGYKKVVVEAGSSFGWHRFVYNQNYLITIDKYGMSGEKDDVLRYCGLDYETVKNRIYELLR